MIKCVIHCADIHIRNYHRHEEYAEQLSRFIGMCREIASKYEKGEVRIVVCGDIVHSKNVISNELISLASNFLRELSTIAKVIVISGNHDTLVNNSSRKDTLTAIFETAGFDNCSFLDAMLGYESGCITDENIIWAVYSIFDGYRRPDIEGAVAGSAADNPKVIGLFHGPLVGCTLDSGMKMDKGSNASMFNGCDAVMCGDIHKRQVVKYGRKNAVYPGSLIQQTFGETVGEHGFAVWDISKMKHQFVDLDSDYGLYKVEINDIQDLDEDKEKFVNI